jgi:RecD/TraA family predicted helicase
MKITLTGKVRRILFRKQNWGIAVVEDNDKQTHKIVGVGVGPLAENDSVKVEGELVDNDRYGEQVEIISIETLPDHGSAIQIWVSRWENVASDTAQIISTTWGVDKPKAVSQLRTAASMDAVLTAWLNWMPTDRLVRLIDFGAGLGPKGLTAIMDGMLEMFKTGLAFNEAAKIMHDALHQDPYEALRPGRHFRCGYSTKDADVHIVRANLVKLDSPIRLLKALDDVLMRKGDTMLDIGQVDSLLQRDWNVAGFYETVASGALPKNCLVKGNYVQHTLLDKCEEVIEQGLQRLQQQPNFEFDLDEQLLAEQVDFSLTSTQMEAVTTSLSAPISIITGGAGVGKTTIMAALVRLLETNNRPFLMAAPTNKAARRLAQQTGMSATSIHKMLEPLKLNEANEDKRRQFHGMGFRFNRTGSNPFKGTTIILDECSMIDTRLFAAVMAAIGPNCQMVLVGDEEQLPPIGEGGPFWDLILSNRIPTTSLTDILRTQPGQLLENVTAIRQKDLSKIQFAKGPTWEFIDTGETDDDTTRKRIVDIATKLYRESGRNPYGFQIITPRRQGHPLSVRELNNDFRVENFPGEVKGRFFRGEKGICGGRGEHTLLNGDIFVVNQVFSRKAREAQEMEIEPEIANVLELTQRVKVADRTLEPAWAITVHKFQGCEADVIIFTVTPSMGDFPNRNMIYTALTRARKKVIIVGSRAAFMMALRAEEERRCTGFTLGFREIPAHYTNTNPAPIVALPSDDAYDGEL